MQIKLSIIKKTIAFFVVCHKQDNFSKKCFALSLAVMLFFPGILIAQYQQNKGIGNLKSYTMTNSVLKIETDNGFLNITPYSPNIIRVHFSKNAISQNFSYSVIVKPEQVSTTLVPMKQGNMLQLNTDSLNLVVHTNPVRIDCATKSNTTIINDDKGMGINYIGDEITAYKQLNDGEKFVGLGEKTGHLNRKGEGYVNWNTDAYAYDNFADPIYASIPFYIGVHHNLCYGIFVDNTSRSFFNFGAANKRFSSFTVENGDLNYYIIYGYSVTQVLHSYSWLTGTMKLPPIWSLGFQQCRYGYYPESKLMEIASKLREQKIPCDMLYLDIDYMDRYRVFTWDSARFPDPALMTSKLKNMGFHLTNIINPGIAIADDYKIYKEAKSKSLFLKLPDGEDYAGEVWPGWCNFPDFTKPETRTWWGSQFSELISTGVDGFWNDMNEPAMWGKHMPLAVQFDYDGNKATALGAKNVYGLQMTRATYEGTQKLMGNKRPFLLTRAAFSGIQRYSSIWTGDNNPTEDHMLTGVRLVNSLGLSGVPFAGADISGFTGNATSDLYTRWMSIGVFTPLFRSHKSINAGESEPWSYGIKTENLVRSFIELRYRLMPYIYSVFYESSVTGLPVSRSLMINETYNENVYDHRFENQYMFGSSILVSPCKSTESIVKVYLPEGKWYDFYNDELNEGGRVITVESPLNRLPLFVKANGIITTHKITQSTSEKPGDTLFIHAYIGTSENTFIYYEDDGISNDKDSGVYFKRTIKFNPELRSITFEKVEGSYISKFKTIKVILHGLQGADKTPPALNNFTTKENYTWNINSELVPVYTISSENKKDKFILSW